ncbi:MAG: amino acid adenylation domain-containing protein [Gammaproteobacteria bacterium]
MNTVPSAIAELVRLGAVPASVKTVNLAGEPLTTALADAIYDAGVVNVNDLYGPSEDTTYSTWTCREYGEAPTIGVPVNNTRAYLLDRWGQPVPVGASGELYLGGAGVTRGYLHREELTAEKYVPDHFGELPGGRLYRTGDQARFRPDGKLEFLGRIDQQVKLRGFRIELGEIEAVLDEHSGVEQSLVMVREDSPGDKKLIAYVACADKAPDAEELRAVLQARVPEYMVPAAFVLLEAFPLLPNGKVNRKALPAPEWQAGEEYVAPRNPTEVTLARIWSGLLRVEKVGVHDNFFELGGDSILSIRIIARAAQEGLHLTPKQVFTHQTIAGLAEAVGTGKRIEAEQGQVSGEFVLSPIQDWFLNFDSPNPDHFNQSLMLEVGADVTPELLQAALNAVYLQHDALRLRFDKSANGWTQDLNAEQQFPVLVVSQINSTESDAILPGADETQASITIDSGCLLACRLFETSGKDANLLLLAVHHLGVDGVSWGILLEDLEAAIRRLLDGHDPKMPAKTTSFKAWTEKLDTHAVAGGFDADIDYWNSALNAETELPYDHADADNTVASTASVQVVLDKEQTRQLLQDVSSAYQTRINDVLLTALSRALHNWTDHDRNLIDLEGHGREELFDDVDLSRTVGWFTTKYPVSLAATGGAIGADLKKVKETLRAIPGNGLSYGQLLKQSVLGTAPEPQVVFNYLGQFGQIFDEAKLLRPSSAPFGQQQGYDRRRTHQIDINSSIGLDQLQVTFAYSNEVFDVTTVQSLADDYMQQLITIIEHCVAPDSFGRTPSDFPLCTLEQAEIDALIGTVSNIADIYPATAMQHGMLFHDIYAGDHNAYLSQILWKLEATLDIDAFARAWQGVFDRHASLRTAIRMSASGEPIQVACQEVAIELHVDDWQTLSASQQDKQLEAFLEQDRSTSFDLEVAPLIRLNLFRLSKQEFRFVWTYHHTVIDGWSIPVVIGDLLELYLAEVQQRPQQLPAARPYRDYVDWLFSQDRNKAEGYWRTAMAGISGPTELPAAKIAYDPAAGQGEYCKEFFPLSAELTSQLRDFARAHRLTLNTLVQGVWSLLLSRYSGNDQVIYGATTSGRPAELRNVESIVGLLINSLPVTATINNELGVIDWLTQLQGQQLTARQYEYSSLVEIQGWSAVPRGTPLFNTLLVFENYPEVSTEALHDKDTPLITYLQPVEWTHYPLTAACMVSDQFVLRLDYDSQYYDQQSINQLGSHFMALLENIMALPDCTIAELPMLSDNERQHLLVELNDTAVEYPTDATLASLLDAQAEATPDATALIYDGESLAYKELNVRANQLAHWLIGQGAEPDQLIGVCMQRSIDMVVALHGIVKAGCAYVPLDPDYPQHRLEHMLEDASVSILLSQSDVESVLPAHEATVLLLDEADLGDQSTNNPPVCISPDNLAYAIFTSGSTGRPKGVMNEHRGIVNRLLWMQDEYQLTQADRVLQKTPFSFDVSVWEFFWPFLSGATLVMARPGGHQDPAYLAELIREQDITTLHFVPSMLQVFLQQGSAAGCTSLKRVICSGEALSHDLQARFFEVFAEAGLHNLYGPTEAAIDVTYHACDRKSQSAVVPIGRPVANTQIYIVDGQGQPVPAGVPGELWIGGVQVARGYVNRPELTAERFINDPFIDVEGATDDGARVYRTGDLVRYAQDGAIEFLGRIDHQVKLRGFRIELGEIEAQLDALSSVSQSLVLLREDAPGQARLVAYVTGETDTQLMKQHLAEELPEYMVPGVFVSLEAFPLLPNGKVNRKALPIPELQHTQAYVAPATSEQKKLAEIWQEVLRVEQVGIHDDFFELGGHSLLATQVMSRVRDEFGVAPDLRKLFSSPVLEDFAAYLGEMDRDGREMPAIVPVPHDEGAPLSFAQQRLWFLDQLEGGGASYNVPSAIRLKGPLRADLLQQAVNDLVIRHESLRTTFRQQGDAPLQFVADELTIPLHEMDMGSVDISAVEHELTRLSREAFDLAAGPLLRLHLLRFTADDHVLVVVMHHIVSDAWSLNILFGELMSFYDARRTETSPGLSSLPVQFADYAIWQRDWLSGEELDRQLEYWKTQLAGAPAAINLPTDRPHPPVQSYDGAIIARTLGKDLQHKLERLARDHNATLFMTLLTAFSVLLARYSGEDDIVIGSPVAGRNQSETEGLIGFFLNTLCLRADLSDNPGFTELLKQVSDMTLDAYAHQELPFESLVEAVQPVRDLSRTPLFQVLFTLQNAPETQQRFDDLQLEGVMLNQNIAKFELSLGVQEVPDGLLAGFEYNTSLFDAATVERLFDHFERLLDAIVNNPAQAIGELPLLDAGEADQQLIEWNKTEQAYPSAATLHEWFAEHAHSNPDVEAVVCEGQPLSYSELDHRANELAHRLRELGAGPDVLIAVCTERSADMLIGVLGVLKSGAAYVPLDPAYPSDRIAYMLEDSAATVLVTQQALAEELPTDGLEVVYADDFDGSSATAEQAPADTGVTAENLAYVIYTSGSTGKPKGVQLEHRSVINFLVSMTGQPGVNSADRLLAVTTLCFDISVLELMLPLVNGATVVMATRDESVDGYALIELLEQQSITMMQATPATWRMLLQSDWQGRAGLKVLCGGEALERDLANELHDRCDSVWNMYGPTETTIWSSCHRYDPNDRVISVGRPIGNTQVYVLDNQLQPVPVGVAGELFIAGDGVARGYKDRTDLNAERFLANPFRPGERMYRTGDLARFLNNGELQIQGRTDFQVKLRGFRIELGEIEAALRNCEPVNQAVVLLREDTPGDQRLVAYFTGNEDADINALREQLYVTLPGYMVPAAFLWLDAIPQTPNGKVNRKALPAPDWSAEQDYVAPESATEVALAEIWQNVLQLDKIGVNDNFFVLGGHSLLATQLVARIRNIFQLELPLMYIFDYPSVGSLALAIDAMRLAAGSADDLTDNDDLEDISI